jgi:hypothetical protein
MAKRLIIKTDNADGIPSTWEVSDFEQKYNVTINEVTRLYVTFKVNKRRKIKRLRMNVKSYPCELCGRHTYVDGSVGGKEFSKETF